MLTCQAVCDVKHCAATEEAHPPSKCLHEAEVVWKRGRVAMAVMLWPEQGHPLGARHPQHPCGEGTLVLLQEEPLVVKSRGWGGGVSG